MAEATRDAFLGGRVTAVQPAAGHHRSGLDAVLLASAFGADAGGDAVDLGAGAGVAGMVLAARAAALRITLAEREAELVGHAAEALALDGNAAFAARIATAAADILDPAARRAAGLGASAFDHALMNPPFHDGGSVRASPSGSRARAHVLSEGGLDAWFRAAAALVRPGGSLAVILPAARLADLVAGANGRFGGLALLPVHARAGQPALRLIARGVKGSRAPLSLLPGLVLHDGDGPGFSAPARAILGGDGAALADVHISWRAIFGAA